MKKSFVLLTALLLVVSLTSAQQTLDGSIQHDNLEREYIIYIPDNYTGNDPVPLVFNFHGYGSNAGEQMFYGNFRPIADTAGFIIVHPEGTLLDGTAHWNVGGWTIGSTVDDVGFVDALIDSLQIDYNINPDRIYSTGMSNGGFMSFLLACQLSNRIAAIASVTGTMTPETYANCDPQHPTPVLQIHGTDDFVVPYEGGMWFEHVDTVLQYWVNYNNCSNTPTITDIPNSNLTDGSTVEHFVYGEGDNGATTEHFKVTGGWHTWPGTVFNSPGTNYDIDASLEIWNFFARYDINGEIQITSTEEIAAENSIDIYPNPTRDLIYVENKFGDFVNYELISLMGSRLKSGILSSGDAIDCSNLVQGTYLLKIEDRVFKIFKID